MKLKIKLEKTIVYSQLFIPSSFFVNLCLDCLLKIDSIQQFQSI